jgi:integration host factor subunit alpha
MPLIKQDIVKNIAFDLWISEAKSRKIVDDLIEILKQTLQSGDDVLISGFGKFCVKEKAERKGRNPINGDSIILPRRRVVTFKCSPKLKDKIERTHSMASLGVDPHDIFELIDFANQITPPNWIIHEFFQVPELQPGNLYIELDPVNYNSWKNKEVSGQISGPLWFDRISIMAKKGSKNAVKALNKYGDGTISHVEMEILVDDYDNLKRTMTHELAHVVVARLTAQKWRVWQRSFSMVPISDEDTSQHGPIFQWAYNLLIKRVEKIDDMVAEKCRDHLNYFQNMEQFDELTG